LFLADRPDEFRHVPFNDLAAMEDALRGQDVAAVIMETIPATYGFPLPAPGYLEGVMKLCERYGALYIADLLGHGLRRIQHAYPDWFIGIRQDGLVMGLEFAHPQGAKFVMKRLYENGVWAIFSTLDPQVLQFKPGLLMTPDLCEELLDRVTAAVAAARDDARTGRVRP
jgi:acetylornithine/succinyldiaminopimelate/putrescine aminotransferase